MEIIQDVAKIKDPEVTCREVLFDIIRVGVTNHATYGAIYEEIIETIEEIVSKTIYHMTLKQVIENSVEQAGAKQSVDYETLYQAGISWYGEEVKGNLREHVKESVVEESEIRYEVVERYEYIIFKELWKFAIAIYFNTYEGVERLREILIESIILRNQSDVSLREYLDQIVIQEGIEETRQNEIKVRKSFKEVEEEFYQGLEENGYIWLNESYAMWQEGDEDYYIEFIKQNRKLYFKVLWEKALELRVVEGEEAFWELRKQLGIQ